MLLLISSLMSLGMGIAVAILGQERKVKFWFFLLCVSCSILTTGHYVETNIETHAFLAARIVMTTALITAITGVICAAIMCNISLYPKLWIFVVAAAIFNIITVLATDWYFQPNLVRYNWGHFVAGRIEFIANPLSVVAISSYGLIIMLIQYRTAHPLDRNRIGFIFLSFFILSLTLFDYLPHFGIDLFGGVVSAIAIPSFIILFGYSLLKYRIMEVRTFMGRAIGYFLLGTLLVTIYFLTIELTHRLGVKSSNSAMVSTALLILVYASTGKVFPQIFEKLLTRHEPNYFATLEKFSNVMMKQLNEQDLISKTKHLCLSEFKSSAIDVVDINELEFEDPLPQIALTETVLESEVVKRRFGIDNPILSASELIVPLLHNNTIIGTIILGRKIDDSIYSSKAIDGLRMLGNIVSMAIINSRSARELEKRHQLDRFLPPQIIERVLSGEDEAINLRKRTSLTVFFSDLKDFTGMSDRMDPENLAQILNEYLSEMSEIAFRFGGTLDKFIGDAVMVFFGAPVGIEVAEQARQCVRMACEMQRHLESLNKKWLDRGFLYRELSCRIGIHTGDAIVGSFGSQFRVDYTAIGSSVNLASRLEGACRPGKILVSRLTRNLLGEEFNIMPIGWVTLKGFSNPVEAFEIDPASKV